ncbi:Hypothetical predicted protein, partial [Marmota monax]
VVTSSPRRFCPEIGACLRVLTSQQAALVDCRTQEMQWCVPRSQGHTTGPVPVRVLTPVLQVEVRAGFRSRDGD